MGYKDHSLKQGGNNMDTKNNTEDDAETVIMEETSMLSPRQKEEIEKFENLASFGSLCAQALKFEIQLPDFSCEDVFEMKKLLILKAFLSDIGKKVILTQSDRIDEVWQ